MPPISTFTVAQDILDGPKCSGLLPTERLQEENLADSDLFRIFAHTLPLGISPGYSQTGQLLALSITDGRQCRIVEFQVHQPKRENGRRPQADKPMLPTNIVEMRKKLQDRILCRPMGDVFAFDMGPLAMSLYCDLGLRISRAVDVQSAFSAVDRKPISAIREALGQDSDDESLSPSERIKINTENVKNLFLYPVYDSNDRNTAVDLAVRAWVSQFLPGFGNGAEVFDKVARIDTKKLAQEVCQKCCFVYCYLRWLIYLFTYSAPGHDCEDRKRFLAARSTKTQADESPIPAVTRCCRSTTSPDIDPLQH